MKFLKGDEVKVTIGKDKGRTGKIERIMPVKNLVLIPGINIYKRHYKPRKAGERGGIIDIVKPLSVGKIALICPKCKSPTRVGFKILEDRKVRICRKCQQKI